ncbi:rhomboid family intramembrane serine protease [Jatrophihabitans endophyticus]|uniref:rhomboid family intramembrane serine protease n=1 Tax=Jatrophihabitans endophyticus TaxID=1206085 RepID=UPI001A103816|nr:rhomboid family intramembrane serine protease [Jatrophihabitans endophyticus]MBE7187575.1 rhomboid family intramembrane serine protease [Jatrophihabitans endophyticus]
MTSPARRPSPGPTPAAPRDPTAPREPTPPRKPTAPREPTPPREPGRARRLARATRAGTSASVSESGRIWRESRAARAQRARTEPRLDSSSWLAAIIAMLVFTAILWAVQVVNATHHYRLDRFGLVPREVHGLWGVLTQPFLHASYDDMLSDTLPVLLIGWVVMLAGVRIWLAVTAVVVLVGGALTWVIAPTPAHGAAVVGCSGLIFGWLGYLVARAVFSRRIKWILSAAMVLLVFGALLGQLVPVAHSHQTWQVHVAGFVAGAGIAWLLHPRRGSARGARRRPDRPVVS